MDLLSPAALGLPIAGPWRPAQEHALYWLLSLQRLDPTPAAALALPTGVGKTAVAVGYARLAHQTALYVTSTRALGKAIAAEYGLPYIEGAAHYPCIMQEGDGCDKGACRDGKECFFKPLGCLYYDAERRVTEAPLAVTSYAWYLSHPHCRKDFAIFDEAHTLADELTSAKTVRLPWSVVGVKAPSTPGGLSTLLKGYASICRQSFRFAAARYAESYQGWEFVARPSPGMSWEFVPVVPDPFLVRALPNGSSNLFLSATLTPAMLDRLGVVSVQHLEAPHPVPIARRPITLVRAPALNYNSSDADLLQWVQAIDSVVQPDKGIIHSVSFTRGRQVKDNSTHARRMWLHQPGDDLFALVQAFKASREPVILVSPGLSTGHDFPFASAHWQVIAKVPYPSLGDPLVKVRVERDKHYLSQEAALRLVQMAGRIIRDEKDRGETFIVDGAAERLLRFNRKMFPKWFMEAVRWR